MASPIKEGAENEGEGIIGESIKAEVAEEEK
jgi:hypothetical protein